MNLHRTNLLVMSALMAVGAYAQGPPNVPPIPPSPQPGMPGGTSPMRSFRYTPPLGFRAGYLHNTILSNRDELKVTDAQMATIDAAQVASDRVAMDRNAQKTSLRIELQKMGDADKPDMAKVEAKVRDLKKIEGDEILADFALMASFNNALTPEQRERIKTMAPRLDPMRPPLLGRPRMPGVPGAQDGPGMPGAPGLPGVPPAPNPPVPPPPPPPPPAP